jgi:predicted RNA binding protein YcfA (HicA-like mRNA interferase family)
MGPPSSQSASWFLRIECDRCGNLPAGAADVTPREVMSRLRREGWAERPGKGAHVVFGKPGFPSVAVPNHHADLRPGTFLAIARDAGWEWPRSRKIRHYYAIAERGAGRTWWISFPGGSAYSAAGDAADIVSQAGRARLADHVSAGHRNAR